MKSDYVLLIPLTQGKQAIVNASDYGFLNQWKWCAEKRHDGKTWYCRRIKITDGNRELICMHRLLLGLEKNDKRQVDHINGNGLDNRRSNLRICSASENKRNRIRRSSGFSSRYKGVTWHHNLWCARVTIDGKRYHLGYFDNQEDAANAYNKAAATFHKQYFSISVEDV